MTPPIRRKVEAIAASMLTSADVIMTSMKINPRDRGEVERIIQEHRKGRA